MANRALLITVLVFSMLPVAAFAHDAESHYCSAQLIFRDGEFNQQVRVDCNSEYAGNCVQEVFSDGGWNWKVVSNSICDEKAKLQ